MREKMLELARQLVEIESVNTTAGEKEIGLFIERNIREIPYFQKHPEQVIVQELEEDVLGRRSVFALLIGEKERKSDTILFHGHTDTVGIEDFGSLIDVACKPLELEKRLYEVSLPREVREDLESKEYMFGRGACDMKSGDAVFLGILEELAADVANLSGNILLSLNPVEENLHTGIIQGLDVLLKLRETYALDYKLAINNDYICPLYAGDTVKTIYTGTVGKLLPCFYIQGKETHVGQCFEGFDASLAAAKLVEKISLNCEFCDSYEGESSLPPSVLKVKDLKPWYNVQTAGDALVYFNYFVHNSGMEQITEALLGAAGQVMQEMKDKINEQLKRFSEISGQSFEPCSLDTRVMTYQQLYQKVLETGALDSSHLNEQVAAMIQQGIREKTDQREIPIAVIRYLLAAANQKEPTIVLYYGAPYCPHNTLQKEDAHYIEEIETIAQKITAEYKEEFRMRKFFPSLSDSSYLKIDDAETSVKLLKDNFPGFGTMYTVPIDQIKQLNIPAVNYGCYGKDAHKWTERVHIPYTFGVLPELILETVNYYIR